MLGETLTVKESSVRAVEGLEPKLMTGELPVMLQIPAAFVALSSSNAHVQTGKLRLLALSSAKRLPEYPDVPTLAELGYPALTGTTWFALSGPAGMPAALVERINAEVRRGMNTATAKALLAAESMEPADYDAPTFTRYVASEIERWTPAVRSLKSATK